MAGCTCSYCQVSLNQKLRKRELGIEHPCSWRKKCRSFKSTILMSSFSRKSRFHFLNADCILRQVKIHFRQKRAKTIQANELF